MGVTLWIVPSAKDTQRMKNIMRIRGAEHASSESSYPDFTPHITLAAIPKDITLEVPTLRAAIPESQGALAIEFESVETGNTFFRSVYIAIKLSPELTTLHQHVHAALGVDPRTPAFPHVSLCYIDDSEQEERASFHKELAIQGRIKDNGTGGVLLNCVTDAGEDHWMDGFRAAEIWITNCDGPVEEWSVLEKIPLL